MKSNKPHAKFLSLKKSVAIMPPIDLKHGFWEMAAISIIQPVLRWDSCRVKSTALANKELSPSSPKTYIAYL